MDHRRILAVQVAQYAQEVLGKGEDFGLRETLSLGENVTQSLSFHIGLRQTVGDALAFALFEGVDIGGNLRVLSHLLAGLDIFS